MSGLKEIALSQLYDREQVTLAALELVIDGIASSESNQLTQRAGVYISGLILADMKGSLDAEKQKAILSIIEMASEVESPVFRT
ncbi:hypothetical protein B6A42_13190 [Vibrio coralliilyticus]|nr:hypothetical protein B6A42_13190 [Vibrio coralliilyticus]